MWSTAYFLVLLERQVVNVIPLELLIAKAGKLKIKGDELDLLPWIGTFGSSLSMILIASTKLD